MFNKMDTKELNEQKAREYGKVIVDLLASGNYKEIISVVDEVDESWDINTFEEELGSFIEQYKADNQLTIDTYDTPCSTDITYSNGSKYTRENFYHNEEDENDFNFSYEYDLQKTDLTLILDFVCIDGKYNVIFTDVHQM